LNFVQTEGRHKKTAGLYTLYKADSNHPPLSTQDTATHNLV